MISVINIYNFIICIDITIITSIPYKSNSKLQFLQLLIHNSMTDRFQNVRQVTSPSSQNSPFGSSLVQNRIGTGNINTSVNAVQPTKLEFASNSNLMSSQASYSSRSNNNQFYASQVTNSNIYGNYSNLSESSVKNFYKGLGSLPEDRLRVIAKNFMKAYGSGNQLISNDVSKIQQIAHQQDSNKFQQDASTVKELISVMDVNMDKRVSEEDVLTLCRKYLNCEKRPIVYTPMAQQRLSVARRLFKQFDVQNKGYLTQKQVPNLLGQTYRSLGKAFQATQQDIRSWMKLADGDGDGHVTLVQYERSIIRALKKQGIKIYQD